MYTTGLQAEDSWQMDSEAAHDRSRSHDTSEITCELELVTIVFSVVVAVVLMVLCAACVVCRHSRYHRVFRISPIEHPIGSDTRCSNIATVFRTFPDLEKERRRVDGSPDAILAIRAPWDQTVHPKDLIRPRAFISTERTGSLIRINYEEVVARVEEARRMRHSAGGATSARPLPRPSAPPPAPRAAASAPASPRDSTPTTSSPPSTS
ncbi:uncharacterized protein LOC115446279 isoform X2 [Manduca sexta]|uniref:uncharacterized protein LOC115446279 isoform X2 n=1 Tax=Manduca sexta TaxID=7130 RepID=UPI00188F2B40|nr:uncharacterized protein LOC115446279 isoform X2 [Manduca sexta]